MTALLDLIPPDSLQALVVDNINSGDVFKLPLTPAEGVTPKHEGETFRYKMFVVIGKDNAGNLIGVLLINSTINASLSEELRILQYPIAPSTYDFLTHNSHIDCADLKEIPMQRFTEINDRSGYIGRLTNDDLGYVVDALKSSPTITPKVLQRFGIDKL